MAAIAAPGPLPERDDPDVLVVGGGVVGLFCAYHLRLRGASVTVVERGQVGGPESCSYGNTGFVGTQGAAPLAEPGVLTQGLRWLLDPQSPFYIKPRLDSELASWLWHFRRACNDEDFMAGFGVLLEMKRRSMQILREICSAGALAGEFTARGMVVAFKTPQGFEKACRSVPQTVARGVPLRILDAAELSAIEPGVEFDISGALFNAEGAYLRVPEFVVEFAGLLERMGARILPQAEVVGFDVTGSKVERVRTTRGDFRPADTVIAAGTWSAQCARKLGIRLELQPAKGYSITVATPPAAPALPVLLSEGKVAVVPLGDRLRFGGTLELSGLDASVSRRRVDGIVRTVRDYLPGLEPSETIETWSGFRPCTPDSLPFLGRAQEHRNVLIATGHGYIGMGLAPAGGKLIAQIITGQQPDMDIAPFAVGRYRRRAAGHGPGKKSGRRR